MIKSGAWLNGQRIRAYSLILIGLWTVAVVGVLVTATGLLDFAGRPLGTDFANVWTAGKLALSGAPLDVYDPQAHYRAQQVAFSSLDVPYYGWHYPPFFLLLAWALALLPYGWALALWMGVTFPLYLATVRAIVPFPLAVLAGAAFPAVAVNVIHGQNAFLSAALLGAGLLLLGRRPLLAGVAFGLLAYKPQFGILIPMVLAVDGHWRAIAGAALTVVALSVLSTAAFGFAIWRAFLENASFTRVDVLESGSMGWEKLQSLFAALSAWGAEPSMAYAGQGVMALMVAMATVWLWRRKVDFALKAAGLCAGVLLLTPYVMDYDLVILGLSIVWMVDHGLKNGFLAWEKTALAVAWAVPLFSRVVAQVSTVPLGLLAMTIVFMLVLRRAALTDS